MNLRSSAGPRRGYALVMTMVFLMVLLSVVSLAYGRLGAAVRIEAARMQQAVRDGGSLLAVAAALERLETGSPPADPYVCGVEVATATGVRSFTVTFSSEGPGLWAVASTPTPAGETPPPLPITFAARAAL